MRSSQTRRLPRPAWASTFWRRTPSPSSGTSLLAVVEVEGRVEPAGGAGLRRLGLPRLRVGRAVSARPVEVGRLDVGQALAQRRAGLRAPARLEALHPVGTGPDVGERRRADARRGG